MGSCLGASTVATTFELSSPYALRRFPVTCDRLRSPVEMWCKVTLAAWVVRNVVSEGDMASHPSPGSLPMTRSRMKDCDLPCLTPIQTYGWHRLTAHRVDTPYRAPHGYLRHVHLVGLLFAVDVDFLETSRSSSLSRKWHRRFLGIKFY